jgi:hypothetical protein
LFCRLASGGATDKTKIPELINSEEQMYCSTAANQKFILSPIFWAFLPDFGATLSARQ